jgi:hypothetical protein
MKRPLFTRSKTRTAGLEDTLTPLEIAALLQQPNNRDLPFAVAQLLRRQPPVGYRRHNLAKGVDFYTADRGNRALIVGFCGRRRRLMLPISYFLQLLRDDEYDVLVLSDERRRHFDGGVEGYACSLLDMLKRIKNFADVEPYCRIITYGTSMGGFPALRAGLWLGADRAICIGGDFCHHPLRLGNSSDEIRAFDLLCDCRAPGKTELLAVFAARNQADTQNAAALSRLLPGCSLIGVETEKHNVLGHLDKQGELGAFVDRLFSPIFRALR